MFAMDRGCSPWTLNSSDVAPDLRRRAGSGRCPSTVLGPEARQNELYRPWGTRSASAVNRLLPPWANGRRHTISGSVTRMAEDEGRPVCHGRLIEKKKERLEILDGSPGWPVRRSSRKALEETELRLAGMTELHPFRKRPVPAGTAERGEERIEAPRPPGGRKGGEQKSPSWRRTPSGCLQARQEVEGLETSEQFRASPPEGASGKGEGTRKRPSEPESLFLVDGIIPRRGRCLPKP